MKAIDLKIFIIINLSFFFLLFFFENFFYSSFLNQILIFLLPLIWPGLAHGSLDIQTAKRFKIIRNKKTLIIFLIVYTLIPVFFFFFWLKFPEFIFVIFLIISGLHFGISDSLVEENRLRRIEIFIRALIILVLPIKFYPQQTKDLFNFFFIDDSFFSILFIINQNLFICLIIFSLYFVLQFLKNKTLNSKFIIYELLTLVFCFTFFKPLISFLIYFCFLHSLRHLINEKNQFKISYKQMFIRTLPITFLIIVFLIFLFIYFYINESEILKLNFIIIGLSSLTISHVFLINFFNKN